MMTSDTAHRPLVSIGVPIYNGERFLSRALNSLLDQSVSDMEIVISDNASTDNTQAICEDFVRRDSRIRYIRQKWNIGAPRNWNVVVHESSGVFFKWASASDYCDRTMVELCIGELRSDPGTVLCYGRTMLVDENEEPIEEFSGDESIDHDRVSRRFEQVCTRMSLNNAQCGIFRLDTLRRTRLDRLYPSGDIALMAELALYGRFRLIDKVLLFRRQSRKTFTSMMTPLERQRVYDPEAKAPMKLILARRYLDYMVSISRAPISAVEKARTFLIALKLARWDRVKLAREVLSAIRSSEAAA
jgi:glycosyltransferase involved in cell wall biosynthesis